MFLLRPGYYQALQSLHTVQYMQPFPDCIGCEFNWLNCYLEVWIGSPKYLFWLMVNVDHIPPLSTILSLFVYPPNPFYLSCPFFHCTRYLLQCISFTVPVASSRSPQWLHFRVLYKELLYYEVLKLASALWRSEVVKSMVKSFLVCIRAMFYSIKLIQSFWEFQHINIFYLVK